ncbi:MAG: biotin--[acetyl-CoA-carboxylase] ligase [Caldilineaceae bacterium]|nr:biotin--[acetyl-CoA-carboxylase] ligase [Caldilineaceae bacterium]
MDIHKVHLALADQPFGHTIDYHPSVPSTMPIARALAEKAADPARISGAVVIADEQSAGRGRLDRRWETPPGRALLVSVVVAGLHLPDRPAQLPMIAGLAVLDAVTQAVSLPSPPPPVTQADSLRLKWPNDLIALLPTGPVKIAGLLVESSLDSQGVRYAVLGIGLNVNQRANELPAPRAGGAPAASLYTLFQREFSREHLLLSLCRSLNRLLSPPNRPGSRDIHTRWQAQLINLGCPVQVRTLESAAPFLQGRVEGSDLDGALLIRDGTGKRHTVTAGDVTVVFHP